MGRRAGSRAGSGVPRARKRRHEPRAIFLLGFMGAGKSSVGRCLAERLGWAFEDLDERIERRERRRVHEIFRESGEAAFRIAEHAALQQMLSEVRAGTQKVVALGGGAFVQTENARFIEEARLATVFLDASVEELWRRCREQADREGAERPLLGSFSSFRDLYRDRRPHYARALFHQSTVGKTVQEVAMEILEAMGILRSRSSSNRPSSTRSTRTAAKGKILKPRERGGKN